MYVMAMIIVIYMLSIIAMKIFSGEMGKRSNRFRNSIIMQATYIHDLLSIHLSDLFNYFYSILRFINCLLECFYALKNGKEAIEEIL
jgi:hypothetical protein